MYAPPASSKRSVPPEALPGQAQINEVSALYPAGARSATYLSCSRRRGRLVVVGSDVRESAVEGV